MKTVSVSFVDHRQVPPDDLPELLQKELRQLSNDALFWVARRPKKRWFSALTNWTALVLSTAPQYEQILWLRPGTCPVVPKELSTEANILLSDYKDLFQGADEASNCPRFTSYKNTLTDHVSRQEKVSFPKILEKWPLERPLRELGYEHQGLIRGLATMEQKVSLARRGELEKRERDRLDLDFYHLLEHHVERELEALYPAMIFLSGAS